MLEKKNDKAVETSRQRRGFLTQLWMWLGMVALAEVVYLIVTFFRPRKPHTRGGEFGSVIEAGAVDRFKAGSVTAFPRGQFYLSRLDDGGFLAISRTCTHLGCTVPWEEKGERFTCPCHGSVFDISGSVLSSPAPRALDIFSVSIENNIVKVDTAVRIKRPEFHTEQAAYPKKI